MLSSTISQAITKRFKLANGLEKPVKLFDFRSDTVTRPLLAHPDWQAAMAEASSEDNVMDPMADSSTRRLEESMAKLCGKEAALFCVSGTMSNQIGIRVHMRGALQSVLLDKRSHVYRYENGGIAYHCQAHTIPISTMQQDSRFLTAELIDKHVQLDRDEVHCPRTRLVVLENTMNGSIMPHSNILNISALLDSYNSHIQDRDDRIRLHLDGARLWNAAVESGIPMDRWCQPFDSVSLCLSKGVGAPVGSILCGSDEFIRKARHYRKLFGGGWRQSGVLAEMALQALNTTFTPNVETGMCLMKQDHLNTRWLAEKLKDALPGVCFQSVPETNMLFVNLKNVRSHQVPTTVKQFVDALEYVSNEMLLSGETESKCVLPTYGYSFDDSGDDASCMRLVLHYQTPREACELLVKQAQLALSRIQ